MQGKVQNLRLNALVLSACLALPGVAMAQPAPALLDAYGRAIALLDYITSYVGESLLACAGKNVLTEAQAEAHFKAYRERNAALLERAENWRLAVEERLRAQGEARAAQERAEEAGLSASALALAQVEGEIAKARDVGALCGAKLAGIQSGRYDLSVNAEFVGLIEKSP